MTPDWILALIRFIRPALPKDFVGQVEVNCFKGNVSNVTVRQTYKEKEDSVCEYPSKTLNPDEKRYLRSGSG